MTEPAEADLISLAMGRSDERCPFANGRSVTERRRTKMAASKKGPTRCALLLLPHLCLLLITVLFLSLIALIMHIVEAQNEREGQMQMMAEIEGMRTEFIAHFRNKPIILGGDLEAESRVFVERVLRVGWTRGREGIPLPALLGHNNGNRNLSSIPSVWTWQNSLLFATSLLSRIGYGHIVPKTPEGKILCQLFALIGCPLFLLLVADIGKAFVNFFQFFLRWIAALCWAICRKRTAKKSPIANGENAQKYAEKVKQQKETDDAENGGHFGTAMSALIALPTLIAFCAFTSVVYSHLEDWNWMDCFYFSSVSFFGIGYGDFAPSNCASVLFTICSIVVGLSIATLFVDFVGTEFIRNIRRIERTVTDKCCGRERKRGRGRRTSRSRGKK